jgi:hypothetical protein
MAEITQIAEKVFKIYINSINIRNGLIKTDGLIRIKK